MNNKTAQIIHTSSKYKTSKSGYIFGILFGILCSLLFILAIHFLGFTSNLFFEQYPVISELEFLSTKFMLSSKENVFDSNNLLGKATRDRDYEFVIYTPVVVKETLTVDKESLLLGGISTPTLTFNSVAAINNLTTFDNITENTIESLVDINGEVIGTGLLNVEIAEQVIDGTNLALEINYAGDITTSGTLNVDGDLNVNGTLTIEGTQINLTADELNYLENASLDSGGVIFGGGNSFDQDTTNLYWDDGNDRLGIGTDSPSYSLDVSGTLNTTSFRFPTGATSGYVLQSDSSGNASWADVSSVAGPWTLVGTSLYPDSTTYNIGIGTTSPSAKLDVVGTAEFSSTISAANIGADTDNSVVVLNSSGLLKTDEIDSKVWDGALVDSTASTQNYIPVWSDSSGSLGNSGIYQYGVNIGIGTTLPAYNFEVADIHTSPTGVYDVLGHFDVEYNPTASASKRMFGVISDMYYTSSYNHSDRLFAIYGETRHAGTGNLTRTYGIEGETRTASSGDVADARGGSFQVYADPTSSGDITLASGLQAFVSNYGGGTITDAYSIYARDYNGGGAITNYAGIVSEQIDAGTNNTNLLLGTTTIPTGNFSIYNSSTRDNYINGNVGIGTTNPGSLLSIVGLGSGTGTNLVIDASGDIYEDSSSARFKKDITSFEDDFSKILELEPVSFTYKDTGIKNFGYIAEDLDKLGLKSLVIYDSENKPYSIRYDRMSMYILELLKQQQDLIDDSDYSKDIEDLNFKIEQLLTENTNQNSSSDILQQIQTTYDDFKDFAFALGFGNITDSQGESILSIESDLVITGEVALNNTQVTGNLNIGLLQVDPVLNSISVLGPACISNNSINEDLCNNQSINIQQSKSGSVNVFDGEIVLLPNGDIQTTGDLFASNITATEVLGSNVTAEILTISNEQILGNSKILKGNKSVFIDSLDIQIDSKVFITATSDTSGQQLFVDKISEGEGFEIKISSSVDEDITFNWWVIN